jgi:hypothetical protein
VVGEEVGEVEAEEVGVEAAVEHQRAGSPVLVAEVAPNSPRAMPPSESGPVSAPLGAAVVAGAVVVEEAAVVVEAEALGHPG